MNELIDHIARDDALRSMNKVDVFTNLKAVLLNDRTYELVYSARANS